MILAQIFRLAQFHLSRSRWLDYSRLMTGRMPESLIASSFIGYHTEGSQAGRSSLSSITSTLIRPSVTA